jgi:3',5'-cyclic AMP phosphodiesterase CpdA
LTVDREDAPAPRWPISSALNGGDMPKPRATIVHISDLHFGGDINHGLLPQLKSLIKSQTPNFLVVSGDVNENPSPFSMKQACKYLDEVCMECNLKPEQVLVIPGNHDYKLKGNIGLRRLTRMPFDIYFRQQGHKLTGGQRLNIYLKLGLNALWPWGRELRDQVEIRQDKNCAVVLFGFNSNPMFEMLATGKVSEEQIFEVTRKLQGAEGKVWDRFFKVAVVHHHPLPIPYVNTNLRERVEESFMVFYNAGTFLRELGRFGVDLILHGHKHVAGFTQILYDLPNGLQNRIGVLAAGSATNTHSADRLGNEFNVITIFDDDTVSINQWYYAADVWRKDESKQFQFHALNVVRERRSSRAVREYGLKIRQLRKNNTIEEKGYTTIEYWLDGCQATGPKEWNSFEFDHRAFAPAYIRNFQVLRTDSFFVKEVRDKERSNLRREVGKLALDKEVRKAGDPPFNLAYSYREINSSALNYKEFQRKYHGRDLDYEYGSIECKYPVEVFKLRIIFNFPIKQEEINYNALALYIPTPGTYLDYNENQLVPHDDETNRIKSRVEWFDKGLELEVLDPIPEFVYQIRWQYNKPSTITSGGAQVQKLALVRTKLLKLARSVPADGAPPSLYQKIAELTGDVLADIEKRYPLIDRAEKLDVSLAVFEDKTSTLRFVAANFGSIAALVKEEFRSGEGCLGYSFEKNKVLFYDQSNDDIGYYISPEELQAERANAGQETTALVRHRCLITIPWSIDSDTVVGVLSIGSDSRASRLLAILDMDEAKKTEEIQFLTFLTNALGKAIVSLVLPGGK